MSDPDSPLDQVQLPKPPSPPHDDVKGKISRRLPPPCWSLEETTALIDGYREKWHALNRGNLKANHWEEVAETVAATCPDVTPKKTAVQCRHKMEKLRKRYRTEIQRARSVPVARFVSSWVHYKRMEAMEDRPGGGGEEREELYGGGEERKELYGAVRTTAPRLFNRNGGGGIRIRIPTGVSLAQSGPRFGGKIDPKYTASSSRGEERGKRGREMMMMKEEDEEESDDPTVEIASAIKLLGDTLLRTEQAKMEMSREIEAMRMEMEMKRTKMILESQQRLVEAFAKSLSENLEEKKKVRRDS